MARGATATSGLSHPRDREFLRGREWKAQVKGAAGIGSPLLTETERAFLVSDVDYGPQVLSGLWRAWSRETDVHERAYEGGGSPAVKPGSRT